MYIARLLLTFPALSYLPTSVLPPLSMLSYLPLDLDEKCVDFVAPL